MRKPGMDRVNDGIIDGTIMRTKDVCLLCHTRTRVIRVDAIARPNGIKPGDPRVTLNRLSYTSDPANYVGISCGCYAKMHRQLAHIATRQQS
jgi:hypothetical protein